MNFFDEHKKLQASLYIRTAEELETLLGEGWDVEITKGGRLGRISRNRPMFIVTRSQTRIEISTNERGRLLKMHIADIPSFKEISELVSALKNYVGEDYTPIQLELPQTIVIDESKEEDTNEPKGITIQNLFDNAIACMMGPGIAHDKNHERETQKVKRDRVLFIGNLWGKINRLNTKVEAKIGPQIVIHTFRTSLHNWMNNQIVPDGGQWIAMKDALNMLIGKLSKEDLDEELKELKELKETDIV